MDNEKQFEEINKKIDRVSDHVGEINESLHRMDKTLVRQEENLREHMRRTELNEKAIDYLRDDIRPIRKHVNMVEGALKLFGVIAVIVSILVGLAKLL